MNDTDNIVPLNARSLRFRWQHATHDISFDSRFITYTRSCLSHQTTSKTPLLRLMDDFVVDNPIDSRAKYYGPRHRVSLVLAAVVHFSEVPRFVPYLAPALLGYSLLMFFRGAPYFWPQKQTRVFTDYGDQVFALPHLTKLDGARQRFEDQLHTAIKDAKAADSQ